jgi:hypothetical protein
MPLQQQQQQQQASLSCLAPSRTPYVLQPKRPGLVGCCSFTQYVWSLAGCCQEYLDGLHGLVSAYDEKRGGRGCANRTNC